MDDQQSLFNQALAAARQKDFETARTLLKQLIKQDPNNLNAWLLAGMVVESRSDSIRCYKRALQIDPANAHAKQKLAQLESEAPVATANVQPAAPQPASAKISAAPIANHQKDEKVKVRYNKALGIGFITLGVVLLCLGLLTGGKGGVNITFIMGGLEIWLGTMYLIMPYFFIDDQKLEVYGPMGNVFNTYKFQSPKEIVVEKKTMYINQNGKRQKIKVSTWMVDKSDWQKVLQKIGSDT